MKNILRTLALAAAVTCSTAAFAQEKKDTLKIDPDKKIKKTAKTVGNKTAEVGSSDERGDEWGNEADDGGDWQDDERDG